MRRFKLKKRNIALQNAISSWCIAFVELSGPSRDVDNEKAG
jgi:hypothetical protein